MKETPCLKCEKSGCGKYHDECEEYLDFRKERESCYEAKRKSNEMVIPRRKFRHLELSPMRSHKK